jgi:Kef-type K+ transport system membrane component KefB
LGKLNFLTRILQVRTTEEMRETEPLRNHVIIAGKFIIVLLSASIMRLPLRVGVLTAVSLSQVGEFSFVILLAAGGTSLLEEPFQSNLTVAIILSMLATPFGLVLGPHLAGGLGKLTTWQVDWGSSTS